MDTAIARMAARLDDPLLSRGGADALVRD